MVGKSMLGEGIVGWKNTDMQKHGACLSKGEYSGALDARSVLRWEKGL